MESRILSIIYVTLFLVLGVALYVVIIPSKKEYNDYKKSRHILGFGFMLVACAGIIRLLCFPQTNEISYIDSFAATVLSLVFTSLNFISFLYMIETSRPKRKVLKKIALACAILVSVSGISGLLLPALQLYMKIFMSMVYIFLCIILFTGSIREYDKFIIQIDNFYDEEPNIKWIPGMLWATFAPALIMTSVFYSKNISYVSGIGSMIVYTIVAMKLLSFIPDNIHVVKRKIQTHEIIAEDHGEHFHLFPLDGPAASDTMEEETPVSQTEEPKPVLDKEARKNEKIAGLVAKWIESEHYTKPEINIKDVATDMGTNSNYLSTYLNKVLDTSFATWLNTLRIEKSKEYLCSESKPSIEECGIKVGYTSLYNYSRWFKTITGMSPSYWRKTQCSTDL